MSHLLILKLQFLFIISILPTAKSGYLGCYEYTNKTKFEKHVLLENNGKTCTKFCFPGSRYAGTEYNQCYCGNDLIGHKVIDSKCNGRCPNRRTDRRDCGGPYRLTMYDDTGSPSMINTMTPTTSTSNLTVRINSMSTSKSTSDTGDQLPQHITWTITISFVVFAINTSIVLGFIYRCKRTRESSQTISTEHFENELPQVHVIPTVNMDYDSRRDDADARYDYVISPT